MEPGVTIFYDGACPFCTNYAMLLRLRQTAGPVALVDARSGDPRVAAALARGIDLDQGFLVIYGGRDYTGAEAAHLLALLAEGGAFFNRIVNLLLRTPERARVFYPLLRAVRNLALRVRGRGGIAVERRG